MKVACYFTHSYNKWMENGMINGQIMVRKWMKDISISDGKMDNSRAQHLPQIELVACPHATQYLCSVQFKKTHSLVSSFYHLHSCS